MKRLVKWTLGIAAAISLTSCKPFEFTIEEYADADRYLIGSQEYTGTLKELDIDWIFGKVTLVEDPSATKILVEEETNREDPLKVHSYFADNKLSIKFGESGYQGKIFDIRYKDLKITYNNALDLKVTLTTGQLEAESICCSKFALEMTTGKAHIGHLDAADVDFDLTAGIVTVDEVYADDLFYNQTTGSGTMNLKGCAEAEFIMTSGVVDLTIREDIGTRVTIDKTTGTLSTKKTFNRVDNAYTFGPMDASVESNIAVQMTSGILYIR